jgi:peptide/nickel transport system permease protein
LPFGALLAGNARRQLAGVSSLPEVFAARLHGATARKATLLGATLVLLPMIRATAQRFGPLLAAAMVVESVFYLPGLGRALFDAALEHDAESVRTILFIVIALAATARFAGELVVATLDPGVGETVPA